jgi:cephalosporin-C deacetylase-like acetyl esterase
LFDAAHHAAGVTIPVLCKLAERDDVVPAPSAAAVFHGLASPRKWSFVVPYGHFDGGLAAARRHVTFERLLARFLEPQESAEAIAGSFGEGGFIQDQ